MKVKFVSPFHMATGSDSWGKKPLHLLQTTLVKCFSKFFQWKEVLQCKNSDLEAFDPFEVEFYAGWEIKIWFYSSMCWHSGFPGSLVEDAIVFYNKYFGHCCQK